MFILDVDVMDRLKRLDLFPAMADRTVAVRQTRFEIITKLALQVHAQRLTAE